MRGRGQPLYSDDHHDQLPQHYIVFSVVAVMLLALGTWSTLYARKRWLESLESIHGTLHDDEDNGAMVHGRTDCKCYRHKDIV
jgi:hypothetical protein